MPRLVKTQTEMEGRYQDVWVLVDEQDDLETWNGDAALALVGRPTARQDGHARAAGRVRFTVDVQAAGMLHAAVLRSPVAHGRIRSLDLDTYVPIGNAAMDDRTFIEWDKDDVDALNMMKVDVLALGMLTCIRKCFDLIADHKGQRWELATVEQDDKNVYDMLCRGESLGVFQVESRAQMNMLPRLKPRTFYVSRY